VNISSRIRFLSLPLLAAALSVSSGCKVRYRHDVETPGTAAQYTTSAGGFMRYDGYDDVAGDLEVGSRDYVLPGTKLKIRLAGAIHIGDIEYYKALQKELLDTADVVLFEGVKFEGDQQPPDLGGLYSNMGQILGIGFQKDGIDYRAKNFVHCDVTIHAGDALAQQVDPAQMKQAVRMIGMMANMKSMLAPGEQGRETEDALKHQMVTVMAAQMGGTDEDEAAAEQKIRDNVAGEEGVPDALKGQAEKAAQALKKIGGLGDLGNMGGMSPEIEARDPHQAQRVRAGPPQGAPGRDGQVAAADDRDLLWRGAPAGHGEAAHPVGLPADADDLAQGVADQ